MTVDSMYSIAVTSKFDIFYEEYEENEDPSDMISRLEAEAKLKAKAKSEKEKKKSSKDSQKKPENKEAAPNKTDKPSDKKGKRPDKKDEKPPRFANRQNREEGSGLREDDQREPSGPPRGRGGFRGDRGGNRGSYRGRGGYRGGRDGQPPRTNGFGTSDNDWNVQGSGENHSGENWSVPVGDSDNDRRTEDRGYRGDNDNEFSDSVRAYDMEWGQTKSGRGGQGGYGRGSGGGYGGFGGRGGGGGGSGFRGARGGPRGGYRNAGREYERHSGSYKTVDAPEASETQTAEWTNKEAAAPPPTGEPTETTDETPVAAPGAEEGETEEGETSTSNEANAPVMMTLDEYRAQQAKKNAELRESLKVKKADDASRKINDGQDAFKNMVRYQKERLVDDEDEEEEEEDEDEEEDPQRSNKIMIDVRFSDAPRRGGGRFTGERGSRGRGGGERGRGTGFRGRGGGGGGYRGSFDRGEQRGQFNNERPRSQQAQIRLNDENDFPSLK